MLGKGENIVKYIHSSQNQKVKQWKKLLTKKERDKTQTFLVEGYHLVEEALKSDSIAEMIIGEQVEIPWDYGDVPVNVVSNEIIELLTDTENSQGIFAVCEQKTFEQVLHEGKKFLLLDAIQDPGNLGTMIRTADAAGMDAVFVGKGSVDTYNPKVLRSAQGSHFHLPVISEEFGQLIRNLKEQGVPVYGTALENGRPYTEVSKQDSYALLVGNEGNGVNPELLAVTDENLYIPIFGQSESLNVSIAAGILMYHLRL